MEKIDFDAWWASLPISRKERIARKALSKANPGQAVDESTVLYPACTVWWGSIDDKQREAIYDHCTNRHGDLQQDWQEGDPYGD